MRIRWISELLCLLSLGTEGTCRNIDFTTEHSSTATYYHTSGTGSCSLDPLDDTLVVALNDTLYDNGKACGSYLFIVGPKDSIIARVTDRCPGCSSRTIDLSTQAFKRIATLSQGRVPIRWRFIPAPTNQPLSYHFKKNSNQWWMAVQIRNHRHPIAQVEYATTDSLWKKLDQTNYNYFVGKKTGPGPFIIKVTDIFGGTVIDSGIQLLPDSLIRSSGNFPGLYSEISNKDSLLK